VVVVLAVGVQYALEIGIVKICVVLMGDPDVAVRFAAAVGGTKTICVVFRRFRASRNTSCRIPPAATVGGYKPKKLTGLVVAFTRVMVAVAKWVGSGVDEATTNTVVGKVDLLPAGFVSVGSVAGAV
jgi:hypothetical protein